MLLFGTKQNDYEREKYIMKNEIEKSKLVHDPLMARALLRRGMKAIDCKPLKNDKTRTVIVFKDTVEFRSVLAELSKEWVPVDMQVKEIVDPRAARAMLKNGMNLIDYKEAKVDDKSKMVFVFEDTEEFEEAYTNFVDEHRYNKEPSEYEQIEICFD